MTQSLLELELLVDAGVLAGAAGAGADEPFESPPDEVVGAVLDGDDDDADDGEEPSDEAALDDELGPPRLSVL